MIFVSFVVIEGHLLMKCGVEWEPFALQDRQSANGKAPEILIFPCLIVAHSCFLGQKDNYYNICK